MIYIFDPTLGIRQLCLIMITSTTWPFNLTDSDAAIIVPTAVSIIVFALGLLTTWLYNHYSKRQSIISYRKAIFEWSRLILKATHSQIDSLKELSDSVSNSKTIYPESFAFSRSMSDKMRDLSAERVVSVFIDNCRCKAKDDKRARLSFNLVSQYDFLASVESLVSEKYDAYNQQTNKLREEWNSLLRKLQHEIDAVIPKTATDSEAITWVRITVDNYMKKRGQIDLLSEIYNQFIVPLNKTVDECKASFPDARCCQSVFECARSMIVLYNEWLSTKKGYGEVFLILASTIENSSRSLEEAIQYFQDSTRVPFWVR